jgi:flagellin-like hook-associated protein FlgL
MISGIDAFTPGFLANLNTLETRLAKETNEVSSGIRVNEASDDPGAIASILDTQQQIALATQVQKNLNLANVTAQTADGALQNASNLLDQLTSIASEGSSSTTSPTSESALALQAQNIEQELVSVANTSINGQYVFGGDAPGTAPYVFNLLDPNGVATQSQFSISGNLNSSGGAPVSVAIQVPDSLGQTHTLSVSFTQSAPNTWAYTVSVPASDLSLGQVIASTSNASTSIEVGSTAGISAGQTVTGSGIPAGTTVVSVSGNTITLSNAATQSGNTTLAFAPPPSGPQTIASGTLNFDTTGNLVPGSSGPVQINLGNLADGAENLIANWSLFGPSGSGLMTQTAQPTSLSGYTAPQATTQVLRDASGNAVVPNLTALQVFDSQNGAGNSGIFAQVFAVVQALQSGDQTAIQNAALALKAAVTQLSEAQTKYGDAEDWIQQANQDASTRLTDLQTNLSTLRDADIPSVATQLMTDNTALQAAISAHASLTNKTLFDYIG